MEDAKNKKLLYNAEWRKNNREHYNDYMKTYMYLRHKRLEAMKIERAKEFLKLQDLKKEAELQNKN